MRDSVSAFAKILVANRGEIAIRVLRAANEMGKATVAVFSDEDRLALHRSKADESYRIGEGMGPVSAYLAVEEIMRVAADTGTDAIHPATASSPSRRNSRTPAKGTESPSSARAPKPCAGSATRSPPGPSPRRPGFRRYPRAECCPRIRRPR